MTNESSTPCPSRLDIENLSIRRGDVLAIDSLHLHLDAGKVTLIRGANGSGKTTLIHAIAGLLPSQAGTIVGTHQRRIALVPQMLPAAQSLPLTVKAAVTMGCWPIKGLLRPTDTRDVNAAHRALEAVGLGDLAHRQLATLSGGQRQRVLVAQAIVQAPHILLMDEPTAAADAHSCKVIFESAKRCAQAGAIVLIASHDDDAHQWADRVITLEAGRVLSDTLAKPGRIT
ncbi:metal ABC transporter ATP-binding protein [Schaalia suimastitidis]|uniref:metal ABC transporter ATP-binding protein n=1 Tax=Schaalia suimastitidis TaxID=121163 RepID=UPI0009FF0967|nr:metal ABC transporter ATP-binding protein [Schaalia suimastitidis]